MYEWIFLTLPLIQFFHLDAIMPVNINEQREKNWLLSVYESKDTYNQIPLAFCKVFNVPMSSARIKSKLLASHYTILFDLSPSFFLHLLLRSSCLIFSINVNGNLSNVYRIYGNANNCNNIQRRIKYSRWCARHNFQ